MHRPITLAVSAVLLAAALCACSSSAPAENSKASSAPASDSVEARCRAQHWPQPMPDVAGMPFTPLGGSGLECFDNIKALAPDGHDVMDDPANTTTSWIIARSRPTPGSQVQMTTQITLELRAK